LYCLVHAAVGLEDAEEVVVETWVELLLVEVGDSDTQSTWPMDRSQFASRVGFQA